jgi:hypothetical protein
MAMTGARVHGPGGPRARPGDALLRERGFKKQRHRFKAGRVAVSWHAALPLQGDDVGLDARDQFPVEAEHGHPGKPESFPAPELALA